MKIRHYILVTIGCLVFFCGCDSLTNPVVNDGLDDHLFQDSPVDDPQPPPTVTADPKIPTYMGYSLGRAKVVFDLHWSIQEGRITEYGSTVFSPKASSDVPEERLAADLGQVFLSVKDQSFELKSLREEYERLTGRQGPSVNEPPVDIYELRGPSEGMPAPLLPFFANGLYRFETTGGDSIEPIQLDVQLQGESIGEIISHADDDTIAVDEYLRLEFLPAPTVASAKLEHMLQVSSIQPIFRNFKATASTPFEVHGSVPFFIENPMNNEFTISAETIEEIATRDRLITSGSVIGAFVSLGRFSFWSMQEDSTGRYLLFVLYTSHSITLRFDK